MNRIEKFVANSMYAPFVSGVVGAALVITLAVIISNGTIALCCMLFAAVLNTVAFTWYHHLCVNKQKWESL